MRTVAIIQARTGSSRLPRKVLADVGGQTMLERVVARTRKSWLLDEIVVATTEKPEDDAIVELCQRIGARVFRGSELDVLSRYARAAQATAADVVVRITSDCPLIDPDVIDRVAGAFQRAGVDYASNTLKRSYPRGLDTEVFTAEALRICDRDARADLERVHVTPFIHRHPDQFRLLSVEHESDESRHRWTVDTQADLDLVRAIYDDLGHDGAFRWKNVVDLMVRRPELSRLNAHVEQKELAEG